VRLIRTSAIAALVAGLAAPARADVLAAYAQLELGAAEGRRVSGSSTATPFHDGASGVVQGFLVGVEVLMVDLFVQHDQYLDAGGLAGTWTQIMTGFDVEVDLGTRGDHAAGYNAQVSDKAIVSQSSVGGGFWLTSWLSAGVSVPVRIGYTFENGGGAAVNDLATHYVEVDVALLGTLRATLGF
jgi:hypothetical protein